MVKHLVLVAAILGLAGCGGTVKLRTEVQEVYVPLLYCPAPPDIKRPVLPIHGLTEEDVSDPGKVVQHYKATVKILEGYTEELEAIVEQYDKSNEAYQELRDKFEQQWKEEFGKKHEATDGTD